MILCPSILDFQRRPFCWRKRAKAYIEVEALERPITLIDLLRHTAGICSVHPSPLVNEQYLQLDKLNLPLVEKMLNWLIFH